tara:strand:- start:602 stop:1291 length:690 start_codon:yes stop_codon:yes gene_type:complete
MSKKRNKRNNKSFKKRINKRNQMSKKRNKMKFIKELENRYGFKVKGLLTIEDRLENNYSSPDCLVFKWGVIPQDDCLERMIKGGSNSDLLNKIESLNHLYELTNSGYNSVNHQFNKEKDKKDRTPLIPVVLIDISNSGYGYTLSFRVDNPMIREMFMDTEHIIKNSNFDEYGESTERVNHRFKEHKEYLDYFFIKKRGDEWITNWFKKCEDSKKELLHSEYLKESKITP